MLLVMDGEVNTARVPVWEAVVLILILMVNALKRAHIPIIQCAQVSGFLK